jgi:hypothetical protein
LKIIRLFFFAIVILFLAGRLEAQDFLSGGKVTGNMQIDAQVYTEDDQLGITDSTLNYKQFGMNAFANVLYSNGNFNAGIRFESYLNPMIGFDNKYPLHL